MSEKNWLHRNEYVHNVVARHVMVTGNRPLVLVFPPVLFSRHLKEDGPIVYKTRFGLIRATCGVGVEDNQLELR
jgi:hypothetical protein